MASIGNPKAVVVIESYKELEAGFAVYVETQHIELTEKQIRSLPPTEYSTYSQAAERAGILVRRLLKAIEAIPIEVEHRS